MNPTVAGVSYRLSDLLPGRTLFDCSRLSATLQVTSCAQMWKQANGRKHRPRDNGLQRTSPDSLLRCQSCPVGAQHAGEPAPGNHWLFGSTTCSRCGRTDQRLIGGDVCVSCYNREREWRNGKNGKGKFPSQYQGLHHVRVWVSVAGSPRLLERQASGVHEVVVGALRDSRRAVAFGFGKGRVYGEV